MEIDGMSAEQWADFHKRRLAAFLAKPPVEQMRQLLLADNAGFVVRMLTHTLPTCEVNKAAIAIRDRLRLWEDTIPS